MGELILLLRLEGPLQSWGTRSRWDVRDSGLAPSKSGVIGLIGCALGLTRSSSELERLDYLLRFGVRVDHPGIVSTDYQTVTGYHRTAAGGYKHSEGVAQSLAKAQEHEESTIVSPRDYLHDARFLVALASDEADLLRQLAGEQAHPQWQGDLVRPRWPIYLGRKSCVPTRPPFCELTGQYGDLREALAKSRWTPPRDARSEPAHLDAWVEDTDGLLERQDAIRVNQARFYGFLRCSYFPVDTSALPRSPR